MAGPSVRVTFDTRQGVRSAIGADTGKYFVAGMFERGRTDAAVRAMSFREFTDYFGPRAGYSAAWDSVRTYFAEGGSEVVVARVVGTTPTQGTLTLKDAASADTLKVDALGAGIWSENVKIRVAAGTIAATVKAIVSLGDAFEVFDNATSSADLASKLNRSRLVRAVDLGGALPAVLPATALSAGTDDRATVNAASMVAALELFTESFGTGVVALPGFPADLVGTGLATHAKDYRRVAILAPPVGASNEDIKTLVATPTGATGRYVMLAAPWVSGEVAPGITVLMPPEGYVAGVRARAHAARGPWAAVAGYASRSTSLVDVERELRQSEYDNLSDAMISTIVTRSGRICLYGYRSLDIDQVNYRTLNAQDTLNWLAQRCEAALEPLLFSPIDGNGGLTGLVDGILRGVLDAVRMDGGLFERRVDGEMIDPGYSVDVSDNINTLDSLAQNILKAQVAVRLSPHAELIELTIIRVSLNAAV